MENKSNRFTPQTLTIKVSLNRRNNKHFHSPIIKNISFPSTRVRRHRKNERNKKIVFVNQVMDGYVVRYSKIVSLSLLLLPFSDPFYRFSIP